MIPAVDHLLGLPAVQRLAGEHGDRRVRQALDAEIARLRASLLDDTGPDLATRDEATALLIERLDASLLASREPSLRAAINATGVILHTNLGRAPLADEALAAIRLAGHGYSTLEFDIVTGQRGSRHTHLDAVLREATGAQAGLIANNTAAGLTLTLAALAAGREVIISRGELVEIGGGFRVPDILRGSGAVLREVGTTNRTRAADYAAAISDRTAAILRVHPSNFRMDGFTERPDVQELTALAQRFTIPLIEDAGSGWLGFDLFAADAFSADVRTVLAREPAVRASIGAGVDLVAFSGDKLLGGPQAGIIAGRSVLVDRIRRHPLMRAVRADKLTYAALDATLRAFTSGRAAQAVPVMRMLATSPDTLAARASTVATRLADGGVPCELGPGESTIGGGATPGATFATTLIRVPSSSPDRLLARLREQPTPVIARIEDDDVCVDLRTVAESEEPILIAALVNASSTGANGRG